MIALIGSIALLSPQAEAQIVVGANRLPAVTINDSALDRLGPPLTLPQLFRGDGATRPPARPVVSSSTSRRIPSHRVAVRRPIVRHVGVARAEPSSSLNQVIHLTPPSPRVASVAPPSHDTAAANTPTSPTVAALAAPPTPASPAPVKNDVPPTAPVVPTQPASASPTSAPVGAPPAGAPPAAGTAPPSVAVNQAPAATPSATPAPGIVSPAQVAAAQAAASAPPSAVASAPAATPPVQMAAATTVGSGLSTVKFAPGATELPAGPQATLDKIADRLLHDDTLRVQLIAHATGTSDEAMEARRISLARAVAVRAYLIDKGVRSLRIDVRALGNRDDDGPAQDQVDLMVVSQ